MSAMVDVIFLGLPEHRTGSFAVWPVPAQDLYPDTTARRADQCIDDQHSRE